jgi:4-amino-4-deoxy-L-arabinose transferase-like glycosyltransferase
MTSTTRLPIPSAPGGAVPQDMAASSRRSSWPARLLRGRLADPWWERSAFSMLVVVTGVLYTVGLSASGWANSFYSAAVQAGSTNWEAFFFGSSDAGNSITVDKPPASLWIMDLSVRIFGLNSWAILVPEALIGVATVALLYRTVRRHFTAATALFAAGALAITPVAALMFRFNNPDALLVLLLTASAYFVLRGIESGRTRWLVLAGTAIGAGFLTKELEAFLIVPVLVAVYLFAAPTSLGRRIGQLLAALGALLVSAGWWVAIVQLVPAGMRPYIGGSQDNSFLQVTFGYNGFGRLNGDETGSVTGGRGAGGGATGGMWGATGILRMFQSEFGGQIAWLLPAALVLFAAGVALTWRAPRTDVRRALILLFGGWMIVTGIAFSFMAGIIHPYYAVALAPPVAGSVALGGSLVWERRERGWARGVLAAVVFGTSVWAWVLLARSESWLPWLKFLVLALGLVAAALLVIPPMGWRLTGATAAVSIVAVLLAPLAYTLQTVSTAHTGSIVSAGPAVADASFGGGAPGGFGGGGAPGAGTGPRTGGFGPGGGGAPGGRGGGFGGAGGLLNSGSVGSALESLLKADAGRYVWVAAAVGSESAAGYQLATQDAVMPIGGFNGSDPSPTLAQFEADVAAGRIHYFISGSVGRSNGGSSDASRISAWVEKNFTAETVDGTTIYNLTKTS